VKLNFILPFFSQTPGGGVKIMYEYAKRMSAIGHDVVIYHCRDTPFFNYPKSRPLWLRRIISYIKYRNNPNPRWFHFEHKVKLKFIDRISNDAIRDADATITTWWSLVKGLSDLSISKGKKINLIQGYEIWEGNESLVHNSYTYTNVENIVISEFLFNKVKDYNLDKDSILTSLAIDSKEFNITTDIKDRFPLSICMLYSNNDNVKGTIYGLKAFEKLKIKFPKLVIELFGVEKRDKRIPSWIIYNQNPKKLNDIYNRNAIFLSPSLTEGWALPPVEAMACGCLLVSTSIPGHKHVNNYLEAITVTPTSVDEIVDKITNLFNNVELRISLAHKGREFVEKYTWEKVLEKFIKVVEK